MLALVLNGAASIHDRVDDTWVTPERFGHDECNAFVPFRGLGDKPGQVFGHVATRRQHERMHDHAGRALLDTARESFRNAWLRELHVRGLHDASRAEAQLHECSHFTEERVGLGSSTAVVDQEQSTALGRLPCVGAGLAHRAYLGL